MSSLADIRSLVSSDILRDTQFRVRPQATVDRAINSAYKRLQQDVFGMIDADYEQSINGVAGTGTYNLPTDTRFVEVVRWNGTPLERTTRKAVAQVATTTTAPLVPTGTPTSYYITNGQVGLYPRPDTAGYITVTYSGVFPTLSDTQNAYTPDSMDQLIAYFACALLFKQVMKLDQAQVREQEYYKGVDMARLDLVKDENLIFSNAE